MDQGKKTMRHFYCRDALWETFEAMANDFDCSIDYLVNEAMRFYARSKNYQVAQGPGQGSGAAPATSLPVPGPPPPPPPAPQAAPTTNPVTPTPSLGVPAQPNQGPKSNAGLGSRPPPPPPPSFSRPAPGVPPGAAGGPLSSTGPVPKVSQEAPSGPLLYLQFNGQRLPIDKDQFIIGRGSKSSDLAIKDGNISRKHAAVIRRNGVYYIKDLGSTNGIDYKGMRIDNKRIDEGDVFHICDYELRFTYQ